MSFMNVSVVFRSVQSTTYYLLEPTSPTSLVGQYFRFTVLRRRHKCCSITYVTFLYGNSWIIEIPIGSLIRLNSILWLALQCK